MSVPRSLSPRNHAIDWMMRSSQPVVAGDRGGRRAGVGGSRRPRSAAGRSGFWAGRRRQPPTGTVTAGRRSLYAAQPGEHPQAGLEHRLVADQLAGRDHHLGHRRVGVGEVLLRPDQSGSSPGTPTALAASREQGRRALVAAGGRAGPRPPRARRTPSRARPGALGRPEVEGDHGLLAGSTERGSGPRQCPGPRAPAPTSRRGPARRSTAGRGPAGCGTRRPWPWAWVRNAR